MSKLFTPLTLRSVTLPNRIVISPMCQFSAEDGFANDWHLVHLGARAIGGAGLIMTESTAITPEGRIAPQDLGIWKDAHIAPLHRITKFLEQQGAIAGIQLAHAGRKASVARDWDEKQGYIQPEQGGWQTVGPSALAFADIYQTPRALTATDIVAIVKAFADATVRAQKAGFKVVEIHAGHGYLLHQFLSPLSNLRTDQYGGSFENRIRIVMEVVIAVRKAWPQELPLFVRVSATDWVKGGWNVDDTIALSCLLRDAGVDLIDVSTGGNTVDAEIPIGPGYQTFFSKRVKKEGDIPSAAVGMITTPTQAEHILHTEQADLILIGRESLRNPHWPLHAADVLKDITVWPPQYVEASLRKMPMKPDIQFANK